jgi:imidazolonepropionase-like amidohydrolase
MIDNQVGRLIPGLQADIVVSSGQPLDPRSAVELVIVEGEIAYDIHEGQLY